LCYHLKFQFPNRMLRSQNMSFSNVSRFRRRWLPKCKPLSFLVRTGTRGTQCLYLRGSSLLPIYSGSEYNKIYFWNCIHSIPVGHARLTPISEIMSLISLVQLTEGRGRHAGLNTYRTAQFPFVTFCKV